MPTKARIVAHNAQAIVLPLPEPRRIDVETVVIAGNHDPEGMDAVAARLPGHWTLAADNGDHRVYVSTSYDLAADAVEFE
jgi:DNA repair exonuclease SbcCD nuclease subunit